MSNNLKIIHYSDSNKFNGSYENTCLFVKINDVFDYENKKRKDIPFFRIVGSNVKLEDINYYEMDNSISSRDSLEIGYIQYNSLLYVPIYYKNEVDIDSIKNIGFGIEKREYYIPKLLNTNISYILYDFLLNKLKEPLEYVNCNNEKVGTTIIVPRIEFIDLIFIKKTQLKKELKERGYDVTEIK